MWVREGKGRAPQPLERWLWKGMDPPKDPGKTSGIHGGAEGLVDTPGRMQKSVIESMERQEPGS